MNKITLPPAVTRKAGRLMLLADKNSPQILFGAGVVGVVGTVVLACRATLKVNDVLEDAQKDLANVDFVVARNQDGYDIHDAKRDVGIIRVKTGLKIVKLYTPAVIVGGLSIAALTTGHRIQQNRIAGLTAAYAALEKGFEAYRKRVVDELGEDKDREFRYGVVTETVTEKTDKGEKTFEVKRVGPNGASIYARFFDQYNKHWEPYGNANKHFLQLQQTYANDRLNAYGHLFLNEVYDMLGMPRTPEGQIVGWVWRKNPQSKDGYVDFGLFENNNPEMREFLNGREGWLLDFNVDGPVYDLLNEEA